jgi:hypothetical protein
MSIVDLALEIRESLLRAETDGVRLRLVRQFLMDIGRAGVAVPSWSSTTDKFLNTWWFLMPFASLHGTVMAETPAAFANRGVFISRDSLMNI